MVDEYTNHNGCSKTCEYATSNTEFLTLIMSDWFLNDPTIKIIAVKQIEISIKKHVEAVKEHTDTKDD